MGQRSPWTTDPIISTYKFTNAYRAADRVSQYLIRNVIFRTKYSLPDVVFRILLFKLFNRIRTWELLEEAHGELTTASFDAKEFGRTLTNALNAGGKIYSAAYIMPCAPLAVAATRKHVTHLALLQRMLTDQLPDKLASEATMDGAYRLLLDLPGLGPFLAYQFVTDINYSDCFDYSEMEFVVPGPGARDGIRKCFSSLGDFSEADAIRWAAERQDDAFMHLNLHFQSLWGRPLQLIDCQNLFCEVDKYARVAHPDVAGYSGRSRIKQKFSPAASPLAPWFPPKWRLNDRITRAAYPTLGPSLL